MKSNRLVSFDVTVGEDFAGGRVKVFDIAELAAPRLVFCGRSQESDQVVFEDRYVIVGGTGGLDIFDVSRDAPDCLHPRSPDWRVPGPEPKVDSVVAPGYFGLAANGGLLWTISPWHGLTQLELGGVDGPLERVRYPNIHATRVAASRNALFVGELSGEFQVWNVKKIIAFDHSVEDEVVPIASVDLDVLGLGLLTTPTIVADGTSAFVSGDSLVAVMLK